jgi:hypothetical protein
MLEIQKSENKAGGYAGNSKSENKAGGYEGWRL